MCFGSDTYESDFLKFQLLHFIYSWLLDVIIRCVHGWMCVICVFLGMINMDLIFFLI